MTSIAWVKTESRSFSGQSSERFARFSCVPARAGEPGRWPPPATDLLVNPPSELVFGSANIWEIVANDSLGRTDFRVDP